MSTDRDRFRIELDVEPSLKDRSSPEISRHLAANFGPFRIALIGDFSGRASRGIAESRAALATRRPMRVDRDSVDATIAQIAPRLSVPIGPNAEASEIAFTSLDDFHPDRLYQRIPFFRALRDAGARLEASASLTSSTPATPVGVLDAILGDTPMPPGGASLAQPVSRTGPTRTDDGLAELISRAVAPHLVRTPTASEEDARSRTNHEVTSAMRALLHHPDFQRLEALWRGVDFVVRRLETDSALQLYLVDASAEELKADIAGGSIEESATYRLFVDGRVGTPGMRAWALLAGAFSVGASDAGIIDRLGMLARDAGAAFVADAAPELAGAADLAATPDPDDWAEETSTEWEKARESSAAPYVSLLFPRLLLRIPYGKNADPCELFPFEEFSANSRPRHEELLWGSAALAGVCAIGEGFSESGWDLHASREISGLPLHVYRVDGESVSTPCIEVLFGERTAERLIDRGITPLMGVRDGDSVILPQLQSIAATPAPLMGRWSRTRHGHRD